MMVRALIIATSFFLPCSHLIAQVTIFDFILSSPQVLPDNTIRGEPGSKVSIDFQLFFETMNEGTNRIIVPLRILTPNAPHDTEINISDCTRTCIARRIFQNIAEKPISKFQADVTEYSFQNKIYKGIILDLETDRSNLFFLPRGKTLLLEFSVELTIPNIDSQISLNFSGPPIDFLPAIRSPTVIFLPFIINPKVPDFLFTLGPNVKGLIPGDLDLNGKTDITDVINLLGHLFLANPSVLACGDGTVNDEGNIRVLDSNGDRSIGISDAVLAIEHLFLGGPPHILGTECTIIEECDISKCDL